MGSGSQNFYFHTIKFKVCKDCKYQKLRARAFYCSLACHKEDWKHHGVIHMQIKAEEEVVKLWEQMKKKEKEEEKEKAKRKLKKPGKD